MMTLVGRAGRLLQRIADPPIPTPALDRRLADLAAATAVSPSDDLCQTVLQAWETGKTIELPNSVYGPAHDFNTKGFVAETFPYYFFLAGLVRSQGCKRIVEIGTHFGGSTLSMLRGFSCFDGRIITIDITDLNEELHKIACIEKLTGDANSDAIIKDVTLRLGAQPIDLLYVDANHEFAPTTINICLYATLFRPRLIVIDDILLNDKMQSMWNVVVSTFGGKAINCVDIVPKIRSPAVGFGLILP